MSYRSLFICLLISLLSNTLYAQSLSIPSKQDTLKGSVTPERAWWNVLHYDLTIELDYEQRTLKGKQQIRFAVKEGYAQQLMQIDLQALLQIDSIIFKGKLLAFQQEGAAYFISLPPLAAMENTIVIYYSGTPKASTKPPYDGGIVWTTDSLDRPWMAVACQLVGGSIWYPCKDHYSEEPDQGATLRIIVPDSLVAIGNGRLTHQKMEAGQTTYQWEVTHPINNYGLSFYIGHYQSEQAVFKSEKGDLDMQFWVLDYHQKKIEDYLIPEVSKTLSAFEHWFGPYPFYEDGFQLIEAPYIGMEHQSAIGYGNQFKKGRFTFKNLSALDYKTDRLIVHELAHEWFGNNITMSDMADRWVQEGFAALGEELMMEYHFGKAIGHEFFTSRQKNYIKNEQALISPYGIFQDAGPDMYFKGWAIAHMIREMINDDEKFRLLLRAMNEQLNQHPIYSRTLEDFISAYTGIDFNLFFDQYLRKAAIPILQYRREGPLLHYRLKAGVKGLTIPIKLKDWEKRIQVTEEWQQLDVPKALQQSPILLDRHYLLEVEQVSKEH